MSWIRKQIRLYFLFSALDRAEKAWDTAQDGAEWNACRNRVARLRHMVDKTLWPDLFASKEGV